MYTDLSLAPNPNQLLALCGLFVHLPTVSKRCYSEKFVAMSPARYGSLGTAGAFKINTRAAFFALPSGCVSPDLIGEVRTAASKRSKRDHCDPSQPSTDLLLSLFIPFKKLSNAHICFHFLLFPEGLVLPPTSCHMPLWRQWFPKSGKSSQGWTSQRIWHGSLAEDLFYMKRVPGSNLGICS